MKHFPILSNKAICRFNRNLPLALLLVGPSAMAGTQTVAGHIDDLIDVSYAADPLSIDSWLQQARLSVSDGVREDTFGQSVAISGDTVVVAAE